MVADNNVVKLTSSPQTGITVTEGIALLNAAVINVDELRIALGLKAKV